MTHGLFGMRVALDYRPLLLLARRPDGRSLAEVVPVLRAALSRETGCPLAAGLVDGQHRLFAVAPVLGDALEGNSPCRITVPSVVWRTVIAAGARAAILAHRHAGGGFDEPTAADLESAVRVHAQGLELGLVLLDALVLGPGEECLSLRTVGLAVEARRTGANRGTPEHPNWRARRWHRRPDPLITRRSASARAAVWRCRACERQQNYKQKCRYCGAPRPG